MNQIHNIVQFPCDAQSNPFFCALTSALLTALGYTEETPYYCPPKGSLCIQCGNCGSKTNLQKHHNTLYHDYQTVTGVSFGWAWPEDRSAKYHTVEKEGAEWRWPDEFVNYLMGYAGFTWRRISKGTDKDMVYQAITDSIDQGFPVLMKLGTWVDWHVVTGYQEGVLYGMDSHSHYHKHVHPQVQPDSYREDGLFVMSGWFEVFEDLIVITGHCKPSVMLTDVLGRIIQTLEHPVHQRLEADLMSKIDQITPDNAEDTAKWLNDVASFPIEARWHAAETFSSGESTTFGIQRMTQNKGVNEKLRAVFSSYVEDKNKDTHGVCWRIWSQLGVGPESGYALSPNVKELVIRPETQAELKRLFSIIFENDRNALRALREALELNKLLYE